MIDDNPSPWPHSLHQGFRPLALCMLAIVLTAFAVYVAIERGWVP